MGSDGPAFDGNPFVGRSGRCGLAAELGKLLVLAGEIERLVVRAQALAESWDRPAGTASEESDVDVEVDELSEGEYDDEDSLV